jgi:HlyD family secretion protein
LAAIFLLLCSALVWGFIGEIVTTADGEGIIVSTSRRASATVSSVIPSGQQDVHDLQLLAYISTSDAAEIKSGMDVRVFPAKIKREEYGFIKGEVVDVSSYSITSGEQMDSPYSKSLPKNSGSFGAVQKVRVALKVDPASNSFSWSASNGTPISVPVGTLCTIQIVTQRERPISLVLPYIHKRKLAGT